MRIVKEIADTIRYYVVKEPINETRICYQFNTEAEAKAFMQGFYCRARAEWRRQGRVTNG